MQFGGAGFRALRTSSWPARGDPDEPRRSGLYSAVYGLWLSVRVCGFRIRVYRMWGFNGFGSETLREVQISFPCL